MSTTLWIVLRAEVVWNPTSLWTPTHFVKATSGWNDFRRHDFTNFCEKFYFLQDGSDLISRSILGCFFWVVVVALEVGKAGGDHVDWTFVTVFLCCDGDWGYQAPYTSRPSGSKCKNLQFCFLSKWWRLMDNKVVDFGPRLEFLYKVALLIEKLLCHRKISLLVVTSVLGSHHFVKKLTPVQECSTVVAYCDNYN